jgi:hypothetical protein
MKKASITNRFRRAARVGLGGAIIAGFSVIGAGAASAAVPNAPAQIVHITVPVHCTACLNPQPLPP